MRKKFGERSEYKIKREDALTIVIVTVVTLATDLAIAVVSGVVWSALVYAWDSGTAITAEASYEVGDGNKKRKVYTVSGPLFFGSTTVRSAR